MEYEVFSSLLRYCDGRFGFQLECSNVPHTLLLNHQVHKDTEGYKEEYTVVIMQKWLFQISQRYFIWKNLESVKEEVI